MISYRTGNRTDEATIIHLQTLSWQRHYRGILVDKYLDDEVEKDRTQVWHSRLQEENVNRHIIMAEDMTQPCGFACTFLDHDSTYGALLDNLHVLREYQGHGIGAQLLVLSAQWVFKRNPKSSFYLWVFQENEQAKTFYQKMGARLANTQMIENPGGGSAEIIRCVWDDLIAFAGVVNIH